MRYEHISDCPKCGAPLYRGAEVGKTDEYGFLIELPQIFYTCWCRMQTVLNPIYPAPQPNPPVLPMGPNPFDPIWPNRWTWTVEKPSDTQCKGIPWDQFCGSGSIGQNPNLHVTVVF